MYTYQIIRKVSTECISAFCDSSDCRPEKAVFLFTKTFAFLNLFRKREREKEKRKSVSMRRT